MRKSVEPSMTTLRLELAPTKARDVPELSHRIPIEAWVGGV